MNKVIAIGIDSLDSKLLMKFKKELQNFTRLRKLSPQIRSASIFPVDSIPAWISIYTGQNPARHGILYSFDVFGENWKNILEIDTSIFKGKTFWDRASDNGKKVCILNPFLAYPPWTVNGIMVSRSTNESSIEGEDEMVIKKEVKAEPPESMQKHHIPDFIKGTRGRPPRRQDFGRYVEILKEVTIEEGELALNLSEEVEYDLFFCMFGWLDIIQHLFWRYCDETDPTFPGENPYIDVIKDFYKIYDRIIGNFMEQHMDSTILVFSDHGHAMRPIKTVNINEILRKKGLLLIKSGKGNPFPYLIENVKRKTLDFIKKYELDYMMISIAKARGFSSISKNVYMSSMSIDLEKSIAYLSSFAGPKSYSHGGIEIKKENLKGGEYEEVRENIIKELQELKVLQTGEPLIQWICRREELYQGPNIDLYPDIVFELKEGHGVYWGIYTPLIGTAYEHNLASGGHHKDAVFLIANCDKKPKRGHINIMDIGPTILDLMGLKIKEDIDGKSIF